MAPGMAPNCSVLSQETFKRRIHTNMKERIECNKTKKNAVNKFTKDVSINVPVSFKKYQNYNFIIFTGSIK